MVKRALDIVLSSLGIILSLPLIGIAVLAIRIKIAKQPIFKQLRPGKAAKPFCILKLRTMCDERDTAGNLLPDDQRLNSWGRLIRATSFDELPQLWNVLKGDLSLVGPRPLLMSYLERYTPEQARRHEVKPGITGWAQINGRNAISWEEKFKLDVWYVDHQSFWLDLKILWLTLLKVVRRKDINNAGSVTMPEFMGSDFHGQGQV